MRFGFLLGISLVFCLQSVPAKRDGSAHPIRWYIFLRSNQQSIESLQSTQIDDHSRPLLLLVFFFAKQILSKVLVLAHFQVVSIDKIEADYEFHASTWDRSDFAAWAMGEST